MSAADDEYESLRRRADEMRAHLMGTLENLERKRHELGDLRVQLRRHPVAAISLMAGVVVVASMSALGRRMLVGVAGFAAVWLSKRSIRRLLPQRI